MPDIHVSKSIKINAPAEEVYGKLNDFHHWTAWSPWLILEPGVKVNTSADGKFYEWDGKIVGSGNMRITGEEQGKSVDYDLNFLKPWKSKARVGFEISPDGNKTDVTWKMNSSLPFFMFWMKKMMEAYIGMDFQRGLNLLKDYAEDGKVHSTLDFKGTSTYPGCTYIGIHRETTMDKVGLDMKEDFTKLWEFMGDKKDLIAGKAFSTYHKWDMVKNKVAYTSGIPVSKFEGSLPEGLVQGHIPEVKIYTIRHTGPYLHLGNAWSALYSMQRAKSFKVNKKTPPLETYENFPGEVQDNELVTEVHFPVK